MCRGISHGGRRCPHDTSEARQMRRIKNRTRIQYSSILDTAKQQADNSSKKSSQLEENTQPVFSYEKLEEIKTEMDKLHALRERCVQMPQGPVVVEGVQYPNGSKGVDAIDSALERKVIEAGDQIVQLAEQESGLSEKSVSDFIRGRAAELNTILDEKADDEDAQKKKLLDQIEKEKQEITEARELFEAAHREDYPHETLTSFHARISTYLRNNPNDETAKGLYATYDAFWNKHAKLEVARWEVDKKTDLYEIRQEAKQLLSTDGEGHPKVKEMLSSHAESYLTVLKNVRNFGGVKLNIDPASKKAQVKVLAEALENYPSEWIQASNEKEGSLVIKYTGGRAHYSEKATQKQSKNEIVVSGWPTIKPRGAVLTNEYDKFPLVYKKAELNENGDYAYTTESGYTYTTSASAQQIADGDEAWQALSYEYPYRYTSWDDGSDTKGYEKPRGNGWEQYTYKVKDVNGGEDKIVSSWRRPKMRKRLLNSTFKAELTIDKSSSPVGKSNGYATAVHEFAHRVEDSGPPMISRMESVFLSRRSTTAEGTREKLINIHGRATEIGYKDSFVNQYMGRVYRTDPKYKEILSTGMESLFGGNFGGLVGGGGQSEDPEMKRFILGILATAK